MDCFVKTSDKETADKLIETGFKLINFESGFWTFINNPKLNFTDDKVKYSNILNI